MKYFAPLLFILITLGCQSRPMLDAADSMADPTASEDACDDGSEEQTSCDCSSDCDEEFVPPQEDEWHNQPRTIADAGIYVSENPEEGSFPLVQKNSNTPLAVSDQDFPGVIRAARDLQTDIGRVTSKEPNLIDDGSRFSGERAVLIGTLGRSPLIDPLIEEGKLDVDSLEGKWETFVITTVENPTEELERALVIMGSDQRGTIFGIYDLAAQIGVSPWHFWADIPPQKKSELHIAPGRHSQGQPAVKYRGIFINDEAPALDQWHRNYFPEEGRTFGSATQQFGPEHASDIAAVMHTYASLQSDRNPELLNVQGYSEPGCPFSLRNYREMERITAKWQALLSEAERIGQLIPETSADAYYQLVLYPVQASALMYELRLANFNNLLYAEQGRAAANDMAAKAEELFTKSQELRDIYHTEISGGKWEGFQTQTYLG